MVGELGAVFPILFVESTLTRFPEGGLRRTSASTRHVLLAGNSYSCTKYCKSTQSNVFQPFRCLKCRELKEVVENHGRGILTVGSGTSRRLPSEPKLRGSGPATIAIKLGMDR
jgi:hypothetical protein